MGQKKCLRKLNRILKRIKKYRVRMEALSDEELASLTIKFKERIQQGESLDKLLPEAYAAICEADYRVLGMLPHDVQILGGIALHQGYLAEMNTGEGKTLVATMPLYLNALTGKSNILVTTNEYLALRDAEQMGEVYRFMGLTSAAGVSAKDEMGLTNKEKKEIYASDIVYTTHSVLGFDYLLNKLVKDADDRFLRELHYVIIDEADSVLLDSAQTPLVISGAPRVQSNLYEMADFFATTLIEGRDYEKEEKKVWLTDMGISYAESFFKIDNFYGREYFEINRHVMLALRAHVLFKKEKEYVISEEGELQLLDGSSGRRMPGVKMRGGQHQALEVKEKLEISKENRSVASITYQNLFLLFPKMAGMSGTISDSAEELLNVYGTKVIVIPPHRPVQRKDHKDIYFINREEQLEGAIGWAIDAHSRGQPVLIVASTIGETELISKILMKQKIPHNVLNANNAFWEADMIKEAGQINAVTVATSMAGRGTDIKLGEGVKELGGLAVIGVGRMINVRQERQARGRAGRQGDPGESRFFVSLEDEVTMRNGPTKLEKYIEGRKRIGKRKLKRIIDSAQKKGEEFAMSSRGQAMDYDQVLQRQRKLLYAIRDELLDGGTMGEKRIMEIAGRNIGYFIDSHKKLDMQTLSRYILDNISYQLDDDLLRTSRFGKKEVRKYLLQKVEEELKQQEERIGSREGMDEFVRIATLYAIDDAWVEEVDYLQQLQAAVSGRSSAQRNPIFEYQQEALKAFQQMEMTIWQNIMRNILLSSVYFDMEQQLHIVLP
ncbi:MAG: accessory Sec system translocase SecA2 [Lachnospiraceae bacterium]